MDKTQLPQDFRLFLTFFTEDYLGSIEDVIMSYIPPKNGQNSTAPRFWTFLYSKTPQDAAPWYTIFADTLFWFKYKDLRDTLFFQVLY